MRVERIGSIGKKCPVRPWDPVLIVLAPELEEKLAKRLGKGAANDKSSAIAKPIVQEFIPEFKKVVRESTSDEVAVTIERLAARHGTAMSELVEMSTFEGCLAKSARFKGPKGGGAGSFGIYMGVLGVIADVLTTSDSYAAAPKDVITQNPSLLFTSSHYKQMLPDEDVCAPSNPDVRALMTSGHGQAKIFQINADILGDVALEVIQTAPKGRGIAACKAGPNQTKIPQMSMAPASDPAEKPDAEHAQASEESPAVCDPETSTCSDGGKEGNQTHAASSKQAPSTAEATRQPAATSQSEPTENGSSSSGGMSVYNCDPEVQSCK